MASIKQIRTGVVTVTTAGTRVAFSGTKKLVRGLKVTAVAANAGAIYLGDVTVAAANGFSMAAGASFNFADIGVTMDDAVDLSKLYLDAATNGDKATYAYAEEVTP